jgi:hypothetical protein
MTAWVPSTHCAGRLSISASASVLSLRWPGGGGGRLCGAPMWIGAGGDLGRIAGAARADASGGFSVLEVPGWYGWGALAEGDCADFQYRHRGVRCPGSRARAANSASPSGPGTAATAVSTRSQRFAHPVP